METEHIKCNLCGRDDYNLLFKSRDKILSIGPEFNLVRCKNCGFVYVNPRPTPNSLQEFYPAQYFARPFGSIKMTEGYKAFLSGVFRNRYAQIQRFKRKGAALEIGCGDGYFLRFLKDKGWQAYGIEPSDFAAKYARDELNLTVFKGKLEDFPLPAQPFDMICMFEVFEHIIDPYQALLKIREMLSPDGIIVITVPNFASFLSILFRDNWHILDIPRHLFHFTAKTIAKMLQKSGLRALSIKTNSAINHLSPTVGISESLRYWLRSHKLYPSQDKCRARLLLEHKARNLVCGREHVIKAIFHRLESILFYPLAYFLDKAGRGENLYIVAGKAR
ncbi:MAG: methyltransferase domain-containing protein [Candidatus Omnitrophota bacterium]